MAEDAVGLLDALEIERAHIVGASLGGMIAQRVAIDHPERVLSLASIMSTTGDRRSASPTPAAMAVLMSAPPLDREGYVESTVQVPRGDRLAGRSTRSGRGSSPGGRSTAATTRRAPRASSRAIVASPDRTEALRRAHGRRRWSSTGPRTR